MADEEAKRDNPDEKSYPDDAPTIAEGSTVSDDAPTIAEGSSISDDAPTVAEGSPPPDDSPPVPRVSSDPDTAPTIAEGDLASEGWYARKASDPVVLGTVEEAGILGMSRAEDIEEEKTGSEGDSTSTTASGGGGEVVSEDEATQYPIGSQQTIAEGLPSDPEISSKYSESRDEEGRPIPKSIGGYQITRVLGMGGMSVVYAALQKQPRRPVALKVMKSEVSAERAIRRFMREVEILGRLNHPCIAQVFDAGTHDDGTGARPFFVMEYVPSAKTLVQYANEKELSLDDTLKLFVKVCAAVEHGHRNKIVHRDLKPSNILIDSMGMPKVIDFGVARAMEMDVSPHTMQTEAGRLVGTIQYMSPEQVNAQLTDIDSRSDVYSIGVLLYKLLTGRHPYNLEGLPVYTAVQMICDVTPPRPSEVRPELAGDLETIMLKSLEKNRQRRYKSAGSLGRDIVRFLAHKPIHARRASLGYRARLLVKRHRTLFVAMAVVMVILSGAMFAMYTMQQKMIEVQSQSDPGGRGRIADGQSSSGIATSDDPRTSYLLDEHTAGISKLRFDPSGTWLASGSRDFTVALWDLENREARFFSDNHEAPAEHLAFSADGRRLVTAANDRTLVVLDTVSGLLIKKIQLDCLRTRCLAVDETVARIAFGCDDLTLRIMDPSTEQSVIVRGSTGAFNSAGFSADASRLVAGSEGGVVYLCAVDTGAVTRRFETLTGPIIATRFLDDDSRIIAVGANGNAAVWSLDDSAPPERFTIGTGRVSAVAFDRAGRHIASATRRRVRIRNLATNAVTDVTLDENVFVSALAISPGADWLAVGDNGGRVHMIPVQVPDGDGGN